MRKFPFLLPRGFRLLGIIFTLTGAALGILRFYFGFKPQLLHQKVLALYSLYLETKTLEIVKNQLIEEIAGLFIIIGLFMIALSREKDEDPLINEFRLKAFVISIYLNTIFLIFAFSFTFGFGFMYMMIVNLFSFQLIYIMSLRIFIRKFRKTKKIVI